MSKIKRWNGSRWADYLPKRWNGRKWEDADVKRWNGSSWEIISEQTYVTTWDATWTSSYNGASNTNVTSRVAKWGETVSHYALWYNNTWSQIVGWNGLKSPHIIYKGTRYIVDKTSFAKRRNTSGWMYQGRSKVETKFSDDRGRQRSMIGFNDSSIRWRLKDSKIEKVEVYIRSKHSWYTSGIEAVIGYHNSGTDKPSSFSQTVHGAKVERFTARDQGRWITLPKEFGELLRDNKAKGLTLFSDTDTLRKYGYFYGVGTGSEPKLRITYKK